MKTVIRLKIRYYLISMAIICFSSVAMAKGKPITILVFGDSLSAGYGIKAEQAWPALLEAELKRSGKAVNVVNASLSGETTAGGRSRFPAISEKYPAQLVIIALGANDGLRGLPLNMMQDNLANIISTAQAKGSKVHLVGMQMPPNYGPQFTQAFAASYLALTERFKTSFTPFLLAPVIQNNAMFQADQLHPTAAAQPLIMQGILRDLQKQQLWMFTK
ncbi:MULTISPECIES: arylesterase [Deefgea]|nr:MULTISPECIES: arylesterase [Deefgea]